MPSPVAHGLFGLAIGAAYLLPAGSWRQIGRTALAKWPFFAACILVANLPDVDYVPGLLIGEFNAYHHNYTHTLGWIVLATATIWMAMKGLGRPVGWRDASILFALLASHLVADWMTDDRSPPRGIMALWPLSDRFSLAQEPIFWHLRKRDFADMMQMHNVRAVLVEVAICLPLLALVLMAKRTAAIFELSRDRCRP